MAVRTLEAKAGTESSPGRGAPTPPPPQAVVEVITPDIARQYLERNSRNRPVSQTRVDSYVAIMREGRWLLNGEAILFDAEGKLLNGQHRLMACIKADAPITSYVIRGVAPEALPTLDCGKPRTAADNLGIEGAKNTYQLGAAISWILRIRAGQGHAAAWQPSSDEIVKFWIANPRLTDSVKFVVPCKYMVTPGIAAALHFLFSEKKAEEADRFFTDLASGQSLAAGDPLYVLREDLIRYKSQKHKISRVEIAAKIVRAWNQRRQCVANCKQIKGTIGDSGFPVMV